ncbi:MAG: tRNA 2-thiouridine(34) synthase MnmA [Planctomycetes bacterium]|nr:tRNA 2-thiouridine(34) synthase MnmA [Planctomycetota bacterium]
MSGGVDSSVSAWLLQREGHDLVGLFMRNGVHVDAAESHKKSCCSVSDARDARMVAGNLGIPFQAVDLKQEFGGIIRYFLAEYARGRTPNPCAICNRDLKFNRLLSFADELGAEFVATGHYARIDQEAGRVRVRRGVDRSKDQSYQLFSVAERHLARARLPLGGLEKSRVRELAAEAGLRTAAKADSQEICFVPSNDYRELLAQRGAALHPGALVDTAGRGLGTHAGTEHFTIGQRRGHGVGGREPLYVVALDPASGTVVLGSREECQSRSLRVEQLNLIGFDPPPSGEFRAEVQVRYHHRAAPATIAVSGDQAEVRFDEPQLAIAPGQGAAFYRGDDLLGGGWIESSELVNPLTREKPSAEVPTPAAASKGGGSDGLR